MDKCVKLTFAKRNRNQVIARNYSLNGITLLNSDCVRDLGVDVSGDLLFSRHINRVISTASKMLGFIRRFSRDSNNATALKVLYCSLVRPHLEYCSVIWCPSTVRESKRIEGIQRKFTKLICKLLIPQRDLKYEDRCTYLGLSTLEERRKMANQIFAANILTRAINSSNLLQELDINVPRVTAKGSQLLKEPAHKTNFGKNNPFSKIIRDFNQAQTEFDFQLTKDNFKLCLKNKV